MTNTTTRKIRYTTWGSVRGCCGHEHHLEAAALRCAEQDGRDAKQQGKGCYSDRVVRVIVDDENINRDADGGLSWNQGQDGPGSVVS